MQNPRATQESRQNPDDCPIFLPLPSFSPPLDFDPSQFALPPSYEETIDLEKALHPERVRSKRVCLTPPTLCQDSKDHLTSQNSLESYHYTKLSLRIRIFRYFRSRLFNVYRRVFTLVVSINLVGLIVLLQQKRTIRINTSTVATLASSNFLLAILVRQDYLISLLYRLVWLVPWSTPLWFRCMIARIYCYGGIHSGAAIVGCMWWIVFTTAMTIQAVEEKAAENVLVMAWMLLILLVAILVLAHPILRARWHDVFEMSHRFLGWAAIGMFWVQVVMMAKREAGMGHRSIGEVLLHDPVSESSPTSNINLN